MQPLLCALLLQTAPVATPRADTLHRRAIVVDTHSDSTQQIFRKSIDYGEPQPTMHEDLTKMQAGGIDAQFFSIWVDPHATPAEHYYNVALGQLDAMHKMIRANPGRIGWAKSVAELRQHAASGKVAALFGVEGAHALAPGSEQEQLLRLRRLHELGVRYMTLTWLNSNEIGGSSGDHGDGTGLTEFGRRVIAEMERLGIIVDLSHVSDPLFWDVIRVARKPVLASHSSARAIANHGRNLSDPMLKAVARNGGAVCVNFYPGYLHDGYAKAVEPLRQRLKGLPREERERRFAEERRKLPKVTVAHVADHIDHIVRVAGVEHACLGSDFDGVSDLPVGLESAAKMPALTAELARRGHDAQAIEKILGGNVLRVLEASERASAVGTAAGVGAQK
jgi:membrane dipeptidase